MLGNWLKTTSMAVVVAVVCLCVHSEAWAAVAAEWTFEVDESFTTDSGASTSATLLGTSTITTGPTGISTNWASFLQNGFMTANPGNNQGVEADASAPDLFEHSVVEGSFCGVMSPNQDMTTFIFGVFGISGEGTDPGYVSSKISYGAWHSWAGHAPDRANTAVYNTPWDTEKWYFLALSWAPGENSVMYLREMDPGGPAASPAGLVGSVNAGTNPVGAYIPADAPLLFGGWIEPGGTRADGTRADWAWGQFLNTAVAIEDMEAKFESLVPEPVTALLLSIGLAGVSMRRRR